MSKLHRTYTQTQTDIYLHILTCKRHSQTPVLGQFSRWTWACQLSSDSIHEQHAVTDGMSYGKQLYSEAEWGTIHEWLTGASLIATTTSLLGTSQLLLDQPRLLCIMSNEVRPCSKCLTMSHTVNSCPLTKLEAGLLWLHSADDVATGRLNT